MSAGLASAGSCLSFLLLKASCLMHKVSFIFVSFPKIRAWDGHSCSSNLSREYAQKKLVMKWGRQGRAEQEAKVGFQLTCSLSQIPQRFSEHEWSHRVESSWGKVTRLLYPCASYCLQPHKLLWARWFSLVRGNYLDEGATSCEPLATQTCMHMIVQWWEFGWDTDSTLNKGHGIFPWREAWGWTKGPGWYWRDSPDSGCRGQPISGLCLLVSC